MESNKVIDVTSAAGLSATAALFFPAPLNLAVLAAVSLFNLFGSSEDDKQLKRAKELIETAKKNGYKGTMKIKIGKKAGGELEAQGYGKISANYEEYVEMTIQA